eukprot:GEMP01084670.1.p2 GENE.GEMP01084670.1~~GEMP01084670.1.p2  ORF type:complete len:110 (+),score=24.82 GEMP01084670.1:135-464(+)
MYGPPDDPFCERPATVVKNILTSNKGWEKLWTNGGELAFCLTREEFHDELSTFIDAEDAAERNLAADEVDMMEAVLGVEWPSVSGSCVTDFARSPPSIHRFSFCFFVAF